MDTSVPRTRGWTTRDAPAGCAVDYWRQARVDAYVGVSTDPTSAAFVGDIRLAEYTDFRLSTKRASAELVKRGPSTIAQGREDEEYLYLVFQVRGSCLVEQAGHSAMVSPGSLVIYDSAIPFELRASDSYEQVVLELPADASLSAAGVRRSNDLFATAFDCTGAMAAVAAFFINLAKTQEDDPARAHLLEPSALSLGLSVLGLVSPSSVTLDPPASILRSEALAFMRLHLANADLNADAIAAGVHTSRRSLYRVFQGTGESVMGHLRALRLESAKQALRTQGDKSINAIARETGFSSPMQFYRVFRESAEMTPGEFREMERLRAEAATAGHDTTPVI
ncbi:helix-turn-helix domain-containing protein [Microbacterium maritypicum]|uniref:helix-turn-helix domain-containing protein n=1 Tax=Microbacterium maritypicum TaxID=33918 RepID=UPI001FF0C152|nr:helix-turn-helix domain-containing protein [Microbacterium liquefaciens]